MRCFKGTFMGSLNGNLLEKLAGGLYNLSLHRQSISPRMDDLSCRPKRLSTARFPFLFGIKLQSCLFTVAWYISSYIPMFLRIHPYVPTHLCSYAPMFLQPMFLHPYVPTTYVPTPLCSYTPMFLHPMFLHPYVPTPLYSFPLYSHTFY